MKISCTHCAASYEVDAAIIPQTGREVKCSQCDTVWLAMPQVEDIAVKTAEVAPVAAPLTQKQRRAARQARLKRRAEEQARLKKLAEEQAAEANALKAAAADAKVSAPVLPDVPKVDAPKVKATGNADKANEKPKNLDGAASKIASQQLAEKSVAETASLPKENLGLDQLKKKVSLKEQATKEGKNDVLKQAFQKPLKQTKEEIAVSEAVENLSKKASVTDASKSVKPTEVKSAANKTQVKKPLVTKAKLKTSEKVALKSVKTTPPEIVAKTEPKAVKATPPATIANKTNEVAQSEQAQTISKKKPLLKKKLASKAVKPENTDLEKVKSKVVDAQTAKAVKTDVEPIQNIKSGATSEIIGEVSKKSTPSSEPKVESGKNSAKTTTVIPASKTGSVENFYTDRVSDDAEFLKRDAKNVDESSEKTSSRDLTVRQKQEETAVHVEGHRESKFWLGFGFVICFALLMLAIRYISGPLSQAVPQLSPYFDLYNLWFDKGIGYLMNWFDMLKTTLSDLFNRGEQ